jgi:predicted Zn-dependent peptidase
MYGGHPLARPVQGTLASVKAMQLAEVKKSYQALSPRSAVLVAVGGAPAAEVIAALKGAFAGWRGGTAKPATPAAEAAVPQDRPRFVLVEYPAKPQSVLVVGQPAVPRSSPDFLALEALNSVLGGSFTSRLNQNLRELHGYTYGAGSRFSFGRGPGPFLARSSVKTDVTGAALGEMLKEIDRVVAEPLAPEELEKARALLAYQLVETLSHADALSRAVAQIWLYGLPPDEFRTYVGRLQALTPESVQAAARRTLAPARMTITIAGDKAKVLPQLEALALPAPQVRDAAGDPAK